MIAVFNLSSKAFTLHKPGVDVGVAFRIPRDVLNLIDQSIRP